MREETFDKLFSLSQDKGRKEFTPIMIRYNDLVDTGLSENEIIEYFEKVYNWTEEKDFRKELSDIEEALEWVGHINNPCSAVIEGKRYDLRETYLTEVINNVLPRMKDSSAIKMLQNTIAKYKGK